MKTKGNSILRKLLSVFLTVSLLFSFATMFTAQAEDVEIWDGTIAESFASGTGTEDDPYIIETASQLAYLANSNQSFSGKYIKLVNDIYLNDTTNWEDWETTAPANKWVPIGNGSVFYGNFDGDSHTIYGIYTVGEKYAGLFGRSYGLVENITIKESYIFANSYSGGVVGYSYSSNSVINNCHNYATVVGAYSSSSAGGILGYDDNCATISKSSNHGKIIGNSRVGGICGLAYYSAISLCYNTGDVSGVTSGGIVGCQYVSRSSSNSSPLGRILNCYNTGNISGTQNSGGICGYLGDDSRYVSSSYPSISRVYNAAKVSLDSVIEDSYVGQIVGLAEKTSGVAGYYYNPVSTMQYGIGSTSSDTYCVCLTKAKALLQESYETFDFDTVWIMEGNDYYPYPKLRDNFQAHEHSYIPDITEADCEEDLTATYTCTCGDSYTKTLEALGHDYVETIEKEGNCTEARVVKFTCSRCGDYYNETTPATGHKNETVTVNATCTEDGQTYEKCSNCGITMGDVTVIPATGHTYTSKATTKATCLTPGVMTYTCKCGDTYTEAIPATCTTEGQTESKYCSVCDAELVKSQVIPAFGHKEVIDKAVEPSCTTLGKTEGSHCSVCGLVFNAQQTLPVLGHTEVVDDAITATCTTNGKTEGVHCSKCNLIIVNQQTVKAFGHTETDWITEKEPTDSEAGLKIKKCAVCDEVVATEEIPPLGVAVYGVVKSSHTGKQTDNVTLIELYEDGNEEAVYSVTVDGSGELVYRIELVKSGTYTMKVLKLNHVTSEYEITVGSENVEQNLSINLVGDIDGDGQVKMNDMSRINAHIKETSMLSDYELACADVNGDGNVKMNDLSRVNAHVKETSLLW